MDDIKGIVDNLAGSLADKYLLAMDAAGTETAHLPVDEIVGLAAKLKKEDLAKSGMADQIALDAERYYLEQLKDRHPALYEEYLEVKKSKQSKELKREVFLKLERVFPDTEMKLRYIEGKMGLNIQSDREYFVRACRAIASRRITGEIESLRSLFAQHSGGTDHFGDYLNIIGFLDVIALSILFRKQILETIADSFGGKKMRIVFYKCLRLTHDGGDVGFHHLLDDYYGFDKNGKRLKFIAKADFFQLDAIKNIVRKFREFNLLSENTVIVSDFDLLKFKGYEMPRDRVNTYLSSLKKYFSGTDVAVRLETEYFKGKDFNSQFTEIWKSIDWGAGKYINHNEFLRIERDYKDHFSQTMKSWNDERNHYYSVSSTARNIAEGIYVSSEPTIVFVFGEATVHGERFNLATGIKIPFLGLEKMKAKIQQDAIVLV